MRPPRGVPRATSRHSFRRSFGCRPSAASLAGPTGGLRRRRSFGAHSTPARLLERLEKRTLLSLTSGFDPDGRLRVTSDGDDPIAITCSSDAVQINGADPASGPVACSAVTAIEVAGGPGPNNIDLRGVSASAFTALGSISADGGQGNDSIAGGSMAEALAGGDDGDTLFGGGSNDTLTGGSGDDTLTGERGNDRLDGGLGTDLVTERADTNFTLTDSSLVGQGRENLGTDILSGIEQASLSLSFFCGLLGCRGGDLIAAGFTGSVSLFGGPGNDRLVGGPGNDMLDGRAGDDSLAGGDGDDTLVGSSGNDTADFRAAAAGVAVNLFAGTALGQGTDTLSGIENVIGSAFGDLLVGDGSNNELRGDTGGDTLRGGDGNDVLLGNEGDDSLDGEAGDDTVTGAAGNDTLQGSLGIDRLVEEGDLNFMLSDTALTGLGSDVLDGIEVAFLTGGPASNNLNASAFSGAAALDGGLGNDSLFGGTGDDTLTGGEGDDSFDGGPGSDAAVFAAAASGVQANLVAGTALGQGTDSLVNVEDLVGSSFDDMLIGDGFDNQLVGNSGNDTLNGGAGDDFLSGGSGDDLLVGGDGADALIETANVSFSLTDGGLTGLGTDSLSSIESVTLNVGQPVRPLKCRTACQFSGKGAPNNNDHSVDGSAFTGKLSLVGTCGDDLLIGGPGSALLIGAGGNDTLVGGDANDLLVGGFGNDSLNGGGGNDTFLGGSGTDPGFCAIIFIDPRDDDDLVLETDGRDSVVGGDGTDRFVGSTRSDLTLRDTSLGGIDVLSGIEQAQLSGGAGPNTIDASGFSGATTLDGGGGDDFLVGGSGPDSVTGGAGNDSLRGGPGNDTLRGGEGSDDLLDGEGTNVLDGGPGSDLVNGSPEAGLVIVESGGASTVTEGMVGDSYTIALGSHPLADVTVTLSAGTRLVLSPRQLRFTPQNWQDPQVVSVTAVDDALVQGTETLSIQHDVASSDPAYQATNAATVAVTVSDNDAAGIRVAAAELLITSEFGRTARFTVVLTGQPTASVQIPLATSDASEGSVSLNLLVFTAADWNTPREVIVTGVDDAIMDGATPYVVIIGPSSSSDPLYDAIEVPDVSLVNLDNDGGTVIPLAGRMVELPERTLGVDDEAVYQFPARKGMVTFQLFLRAAGSGITLSVRHASGGEIPVGGSDNERRAEALVTARDGALFEIHVSAAGAGGGPYVLRVTNAVKNRFGNLFIASGSGNDLVEIGRDGGGPTGNITDVRIGGLDPGVHETRYTSALLAPLFGAGLVVKSGGGNDRVTVDASVTVGVTLKGLRGNDTLVGGSGNDLLLGDNDGDVQGGDDVLDGGDGDDTLGGAFGDDRLSGGNGTDRCAGGPGANSVDACELIAAAAGERMFVPPDAGGTRAAAVSRAVPARHAAGMRDVDLWDALLGDPSFGASDPSASIDRAGGGMALPGAVLASMLDLILDGSGAAPLAESN